MRRGKRKPALLDGHCTAVNALTSVHSAAARARCALASGRRLDRSTGGLPRQSVLVILRRSYLLLLNDRGGDCGERHDCHLLTDWDHAKPACTCIEARLMREDNDWRILDR